jgi:methionyl-tRNA formyltransferase
VRTVYLGTSEFAVEVFERLVRTPHRPVLAVTRPDRGRGRGRKVSPPPVAESAHALGVEVFQPDDVNAEAARARIALARPEVVCICAFGAYIREPLLSDYEMLNVHPSLLPRWRGAAPIERSIEAGDDETGVTIMRPTAELDAGPICLPRGEPIGPEDDYGSLSARLAPLAGELLIEALDSSPPFYAQPDQGVTYAEKIDPADRLLDPSLPADALERRVRALTPHIGAYVEGPGGERLGVLRAALVEGELGPSQGELAGDGGRLLYGTATGALELLEVHPAGKRPMDGASYVRGHGAALGRG